MRILRLSSPLGKEEILEKSKKFGFIPISHSLARSEEQLRLARILAERAFRGKTNIAKNFGLEFLLWLAGEGDLRKAFAKNEFSPEDFLLVSFKKTKTEKKKILGELRATEKPISLGKKATPLELEKISLGRVI